MQLSEIKIQVQRIFGDESEVQLTQADIVRWANDAQTYIILNHEALLEEKQDANAVNGTMEYTLPATMLILDSVSYKQTGDLSYFPLAGKTIKQFDEVMAGWDGNVFGTGRPLYFHKFSNKLRLFPIPDADSVAGIRIYFRRRAVDLVNDSDVPEIPVEYHQAIVDYILSRAYFMDEDYEASTLAASSVQDNLSNNAGRREWDVQRYYPVITTLPEDMAYTDGQW